MVHTTSQKSSIRKKTFSKSKFKHHVTKIHHLVKRVPKKVTRKTTIFALLLVVILLFYFTFGLQVKILISEEMDLDLSPTEKSFNVSYNQSPNITFNLLVDNPFACSFECSHELRDLSTNVTLNSTITYNDAISITYNLPLDFRGEGQKLFLYQVSCNNVKSRLCNTNQAEYIKSALITVNYNLPDSEIRHKEFLDINFKSYLQLVKDSETILFYNQQMAKILNVSVNSSIHDLIEDEFLRASSLSDLWDSFYYSELYFNFEKINISNLKNLYTDLLQEQKNLIKTASAFNEESFFVQSIVDETYFQDIILTFNDSEDLIVDVFLAELNKTIFTLNSRSFTSYDSLFLDLLLLEAHYNSINNIYLTKKQNLVERMNISHNKNNYFFSELNRSSFISENVSCSSIDSLNLLIDFENVKAVDVFENNFSSLNSIVQSELSEVYVSWIINKFNGVNSSLNLTSFNELTVDNTTINFSDVDSYLLKSIILLPNVHYSYCLSDVKNISILPFTSQDLVIPKIFVPKNISLDDNPAICCFYGDCSACCTSDTCEDNYPVIFVHGHAISSGNLPEESHESFARMQRLLESDGYVNAGEIGEGSEFLIPGGDWGRMIAPITVRVSYYYISYLDLGSYQLRTQRTDSIENYAIRLKDLVDLVKFRTGKDKVDVVAHSMGGLVVRQYIALFGEDDINKFIMLGTPNGGVEGRVKHLCSVTGASRECSEMSAGSVFLKRLNDPKNEFENIQAYTITASGCDMDGEDGDGVVLARNVPLDYTTNLELNGNCTDVLESNLHTRFINSIYYPETFDMVRSILLN